MPCESPEPIDEAVIYVAAMNIADQYRIQAERCLIMAERPVRPEEKERWLQMAVTWLGMIPGRQRTAGDQFAPAEKYATRQTTSAAEQ
jgi:hypothetical protein